MKFVLHAGRRAILTLICFIWITVLLLFLWYFSYLIEDLKTLLFESIEGEPEVSYYPFMAFVYAENNNEADIEARVCGGTIIQDDFVLTAAHCVFGYTNITLVLGTNRIDIYDHSNILLENHKIIVHEHYNNTDNDIALIELEHKLTFNNKINLIRLSKDQYLENVSNKYSLVGWSLLDPDENFTDLLSIVNISIIDNQRDYPSKLFVLNSEELCHGLFGGPLFLLDDDRQIGIISGSDEDCDENTPIVFTHVGYYFKWIYDKVNKI